MKSATVTPPLALPAALWQTCGRRPMPGCHPSGGRNSVVECLLPKQKVVGSNPIARSISLDIVVAAAKRLASRPLRTKPHRED